MAGSRDDLYKASKPFDANDDGTISTTELGCWLLPFLN